MSVQVLWNNRTASVGKAHVAITFRKMVDKKCGTIVQAELQVPEILSLDYTLYLCTYNSSDNTLVIVDSSSYTTNSLFLDENVSAINNTSGDVVYYIIIDSNNNPSTEDYYTLQVSIGGTADAFEPNDNGFSSLSFPEMSSNTSVSVPGNLNTPIDNDWFMLYVADTSEFSGLEISNIPNNVVVESYGFTSAIEPVLRGSTKNASALPIVAGYNYFRIVYDGTGPFSPTDYNIKFSPRLNVQKIVTLIAVDGYCQRSSNLFNDGITRRLLIRSADVEVKLLYATSNNIMVKTNDTVNVTIENPKWTATNMRYETGNSTIKDKDTCIVNLKAPTIYGLSNYNLVYTTIVSKTYGTLANNVQMALLDHYDDGELSRPCVHNGTCGYK